LFASLPVTMSLLEFVLSCTLHVCGAANEVCSGVLYVTCVWCSQRGLLWSLVRYMCEVQATRFAVESCTLHVCGAVNEVCSVRSRSLFVYSSVFQNALFFYSTYYIASCNICSSVPRVCYVQ